jgi:hypothetical protein
LGGVALGVIGSAAVGSAAVVMGATGRGAAGFGCGGGTFVNAAGFDVNKNQPIADETTITITGHVYFFIIESKQPFVS